MENRNVGKRMLWQGRAGRVQLGIWEFKYVSNRGHVFIDSAAVLSIANKPGVWFGMDDAPDVRALLEHIENMPYEMERKALNNEAREVTDLLAVPALDSDATNPQVLQTTRELESSIRLKQETPKTEHKTLGDVAKEAANLLTLPELDRAAADQRVLQAARVLESGIRFRQEQTNAFTRATWAEVKLPEGHQPDTDIVRAINERIKNPESSAALADAQIIRAAIAQASDYNANYLPPCRTTNIQAQASDGAQNWQQNHQERDAQIHDIDILMQPEELDDEEDSPQQDHDPLWARFERRPYEPHKRKQLWQAAYRPQRNNYVKQRLRPV